MRIIQMHKNGWCGHWGQDEYNAKTIIGRIVRFVQIVTGHLMRNSKIIKVGFVIKTTHAARGVFDKW